AAVDAAGRLTLVRQWRYVWGCDSWELPGGLASPGETPLDAAQRELREEAGLVARQWDVLGLLHASASMSLRFHVFLARDLEPVATARDAEEHDMIVRAIPLADAVAAVLDGTILHAVSATTILRAAHFLGQPVAT